MGLVRGEDVILSAYTSVEGGFGYVPFGCARSVTFDISTDFIETSVIESGNFKTFLPSGKQYSGNIEGLVFLDKPASAETRATVTCDLTEISDAVTFPTTGGLFCLVRASEPPFITLFVTAIGTFSTFADFLTYMNNGINSGGTGYTSVISGNSLIITARPGLNSNINGGVCQFQYSIDGGPTLNIDNYFTGGVPGYYPSKIQMGWLYDKIISGERIQLKYYETDDDNHFLQKICYVYIESINETSSFDNMATFTAQFKGDGAPIITYGEI